MSTTAEQAKSRAKVTYNAAADRYDDPANSFWSRFGAATIERLNLAAGDNVLDVCCGTGASALPAAERVGPSGRVLGIDLAERLLQKARHKAAARGLHNCEFRVGDMLDLQIEDRFNAAICVFGIFFVPDMTAAVRSLAARVKPGGVLAITTWGPRFFEPATGAFWESIRRERPDLFKGFNPWDRICDPRSLRSLLAQAGVNDAEIVAEPGVHPIGSCDDWWSAVMGSGYRGTIDMLDEEQRARVRHYNDAFIVESAIREVEANVVYAVARL